ncbi:MAG TPA: DinB family protein [Puia sp.]|nr:DinB family protein [Puia sp.]
MTPRTELVAAEFYQKYIQHVKEDDFRKALEKNTRQFRKFLKKIPRKKIGYAYAEGKWTIQEVLQHIIDAERVFAYRALRCARMDSIAMPGFDENEWAARSGAADRSWDDLTEEFRALRRSTELLFGSLNDGQLKFTGTASGHPVNALALGFIIPGHVLHHIHIIKERYL